MEDYTDSEILPFVAPEMEAEDEASASVTAANEPELAPQLATATPEETLPAAPNAETTPTIEPNVTETATPNASAATKPADAADASESEATESEANNSASHTFPTADEIRQVIYDVVDPEINISIIDLGLVYEILPNPEDKTVTIKMTLTSPGCPLGPEITSAVYLKVTRMPGVKDCCVDLVWSPMWDPEVHPTEETRIALGMW